MRFLTQQEIDDMVTQINEQRLEIKACLALAAKMVAFSLFMAVFAWVFVSVFIMPAKAIPITGQLSIFGAVNIDTTNQTVKNFAGLALPTITSGSFDVLSVPQSYLPQNAGVFIHWTQYGHNSNLSCGTDCIYQLSSAAATASLNLTSTTVGSIPGIDFTLLGTGIMHLTGFDPTPGLFSLTLQYGNYGRWNAWEGTTFIPDSRPVPGPIVGAGLPGLFMLGSFLLWRRRRDNRV